MSLEPAQFPLLFKINSPAELRELSEDQLPQLVDELRNFLLAALNECGGHLGAGLGTVELAIALHYIFNTPDDRLVWDVGHQAYPHKILTGRRDQITSIRKNNGLAPFPSRQESIYDAFGVGHSSTSISAILGMSAASNLNHSDRKCVAIIGDGAMTAGMAFEALNHGGHIRPDALVIVNDNDMSISNNVGGLSNYFAKVLASKLYINFREGSKKVLSAIPPMWQLIKRTEQHVKNIVVPGNIFEDLGFNYTGPIDGHDLNALLNTLRNLKNLKGPQLLHCVTKKGKGYPPAEADPIGYHAVSPGFLSNSASKKVSSPTYSQIFGDWVCDMAEQDPKLVCITPAMREGSGLVKFSEKYADRYFDVGIAEQHSVTFAAGLACEGQKPVVAIYSTFLQRAYDQLIHDVALQNLPVLFAIDRAGLVGGDGITHNGNFDLSYLRCIPNMIVMTPADENECRQMLFTGFLHNGPAAVRYPRGIGPGIPIENKMTAFDIGKAQIKRKGQKVAILAFGSMLYPALEVAEKMNATVINMRFVKPLDTQLISSIAQQHSLIVTLEENTIQGGAGSAVNEYLASSGILCPTLNLGLPDQFIEHGNPSLLLSKIGLDAEGIFHSIQKKLLALGMEEFPTKDMASTCE